MNALHYEDGKWWTIWSGKEEDTVVPCQKGYQWRPGSARAWIDSDSAQGWFIHEQHRWPATDEEIAQYRRLLVPGLQELVASANTLSAYAIGQGICPKCGTYRLIEGCVCFGCHYDPTSEDNGMLEDQT